MIRAASRLAALVALAFGSRLTAADPADLFPADALAYAEVARPGAVAEAVAALVPGDALTATHDKLDKLTDARLVPGHHRAALLALLAAPELAAELKRFHGAGVALVGFTSDHRPRVAAAFLLGDSAAAGLAARGFLASTPNVRRVGAVEGVPVFQHRNFVGPPVDDDGKPAAPDGPKLTDGEGELTYAYTPGLFAVGTDKPAVADVVRRFLGKGDAKTLARVLPRRPKADVFLYADPAALAARLDAAARGLATPTHDLVALFKFVANPKAVKALTGSLTLRPEGVELLLDVELVRGVPSALADVLTGPAVATPAPAGSPDWAVTLSLPAERRAEAVLALADAVAQANGSLGRRPSEVVAGSPLPELLRGVKAVTAFAPAKPTLPAGATPVPVVALHLDADAAPWVAAAPKLGALLVGAADPLPASSEVVGGVRVLTLAGKALPGGGPLHVAAVGSAVVVGQDRALVVASLGKETRTSAGAAAVFRPAALTRHLVPAPPKKPPTPGDAALPEAWAVGLARAAQSLPEVRVSVARTASGLRVAATLPDAKAALPAAAGVLLDWVARRPPDPSAPPRWSQFDR